MFSCPLSLLLDTSKFCSLLPCFESDPFSVEVSDMIWGLETNHDVAAKAPATLYSYWNSGGDWCFHLRNTPKVESVCCSETLTPIYWSAVRNIPQYSNRNQLRCEQFQFRNVIILFWNGNMLKKSFLKWSCVNFQSRLGEYWMQSADLPSPLTVLDIVYKEQYYRFRNFVNNN